MLETSIAEKAGFCFGVKRAVDMAEKAVSQRRIACLGPLIHNQQEIARLEKLGVVVKEKNKITDQDTVLIRAHGVGPQIFKELNSVGCKVIDATCPYVKKAQELARDAQEEGYQVVILGDKTHMEVQGINAWTGDKAIVIASCQELQEIDLPEKVAFIAQTTEKEERFSEIAEYIKKQKNDFKIMNTICQATRQRQEAAYKLAQQVDLMIIVGGKHSSNTRKLWEVCSKAEIPCYHIEEAEEIEPCWFVNINKVGITAGASTPAWIIEEVMYKMDEIKEQVVVQEKDLCNSAGEDAVQEVCAPVKENPIENEADFSSMDDQLDFRSFQGGEIVKGIVVKVSSDEVLVDIGDKSEGIIPADELSYRSVDPTEEVAVGQEISVEVLRRDSEGSFILSCKGVRQEEALAKLEDAEKNGKVIIAPVIAVVKGGLLVDVGIRGFVPASHVDRGYVEDLNEYLHKELEMKVIELDKENKKAVLSHKVVMEAEYQKHKENLWDELEEGQTHKGVVKRLTKFGAFVDIGGIDGLLHVSEMSWTRVQDPAEVLKVDDELEVSIIKLDRENERISLSIKPFIKNPWEVAQEKYKVGMVVEGHVVRVAPFGAFIELEPGVDGLAHISQLSFKHVSKVEEVLTAGQEVKAKIIDIDFDRKRLSLSLKDVMVDAEKAEYEAFMEQQPKSDRITIGDMLESKK